jgi:hypothetical protein
MPLVSRSVSRACGAAILLGAMSLTGCGDSGPPTGTVSGTVTAAGKPVASATVMFSIKKGGSGSGMTDDEGKYSAQVPLGDAKVAVIAPPGDKSTIYAGYSLAKSPVSVTVKSGSNPLDIKMEGPTAPPVRPKR